MHVAVTMKDANIQAYLGILNVGESLSNFLQVLCNHFKVDHPEDFGLQFVDTPNHYVSDFNHERMKDGVLLALVPSVERLTDKIVKALVNGNVHEKADALQILAKHSNDPLVAKEFIALQGIKYLISGIEEDRFEPKLLGNALLSYVEIMDHGYISWDSIQKLFIKKVVSFINDKSYADHLVLYTSLTILESIIANCPDYYELVENMITLPHLLHHIVTGKGDGAKQIEVQQAVLALVNALFQKADTKKQKYFSSTLTARQYRYIIINNIFSFEDKKLGSEMQHQLNVLEQLILNQYEERMMTPLDPQDQKAAETIMELRSLAFEDSRQVNSNKDVNLRRMELKNEYRKLGFRDDVNPANDFMETPPGMLALDNMSYFAHNHSDQYSNLVLDNCYRSDSHECPFGRASIELTKLLCEILKIGEAPSEIGQTYHRIMFSHDHAFEELFCICIILFNKTWKEMKATTEDFSKVVRVSRVQITRTLNEFLPTLDLFNESISKLNYSRVAKIWQDELEHHEEKELQAPPIVELKKQIKCESYELVQQHRLNFLVAGTRFQQKSRSSKEKKFQYWRLSPNHKFLHYGNCTETATPAIEDLSESDKISISDIKDLLTGKDCPHKKEKKYMYPFSLLMEDNKSHDFDAPDELTFHYWQDGINALLRRPMVSSTTMKDMDLLVSMELKLRLLDTEGVPIPEHPPQIPPLPSNFNFSYHVV